MNRTNRGLKGKKLYKALLSVVLILALIFTGLGYPGFLLGLVSGRSGHADRAGKEPAGRFADGGDDFAAVGGNSRAFSIEPVKGMTIRAEKDALDRDRDFTVYELEEDDPTLVKLDEMCSGIGGYLIGACEVDAGLGDEERLPGKYRTELDLEEMGVDSSVQEYVHVFRMDSEGRIDEYSTVLDGHTLVYESSQNSIAFWVIILPILAGGSIPIYDKYKDLHASEYYMEQSDSEPLSMNFKADGGEFAIIWQSDDVNPRVLRAIKTIENDTDFEVRQRIERKDGEKYLDYKKRIAPEVLKELLANDEYQELVSGLALPSSIETLKDIIREAFSYLSKEQQAKMPSYRVRFFLINQLTMGSKQGVANTGTFLGSHNYYIDLNAGALSDMNKEGFTKEKQDNMLLTITHELFHLCQMEYPNENLVVDEATAVLLERDAYDWFRAKGIIEFIAEDEFCPNSYYEDLVFGINGSPADKSSGQNLGYTLSRFLKYCRDVTGKNVSATDVRAAFNGDFVKSIRNVFDLEEETLSLFYRKFCLGLTEEYYERRTSEKETDKDAFSPAVELESGQEAEVKIRGAAYASTLKEYKAPDYLESAMVFTMPDGCLEEGATGFRAAAVHEDGMVETERGYFCPDGRGSHYLLEIFDGYAAEAAGGSYYVTLMRTPGTPTAVVEDEILHITLPKASVGMQNGRLDGYRVKIIASDGTVTEIPVLTEDLPGGVHEDIYGLISDRTTDAAKQTFTVTVAEYVTSRNGEECCGPESLETTAGNAVAGEWGLEAVLYGDRFADQWGISYSVNGNAYSISKNNSSLSGTVPSVIRQASDLDLNVNASIIQGEGLSGIQVGMVVKDFPEVLWFETDDPNNNVTGSGIVSGAEYYDLLTNCESRYMFLQIAPYFVFVYKQLGPGEQPASSPQATFSSVPISDAWDLYRDKM